MYVQQNGVDNVYNLGLILFRDLVGLIHGYIIKLCLVCLDYM